MKEALKNLPNLMTMGNLACGLIGIERVFAGEVNHALVVMLIAAALDFFDGFTARLLGVDGEMGKQLDSLADLVTFGVLPGIIFYQIAIQHDFCLPNGFCTSRYAWLFIPLGAAWRLARFNIDTRQSTGFLGTPTPITGTALAFTWLAVQSQTGAGYSWIAEHIYLSRYFVLWAPLAAFYLMVSDLPMLAFKFKKGDVLLPWKIALIIALVAVAAIFQEAAGPLVLLVYVLLSLIANFVTVKQHG
ncbi:MAG: CDP-alcohol phosphatidyltransferase family protein [Bacteroidetes bacterium]|nr:CDP-alcohol phosphatidyltransferase family protein [Bacteroidota bacterium]